MNTSLGLSFPFPLSFPRDALAMASSVIDRIITSTTTTTQTLNFPYIAPARAHAMVQRSTLTPAPTRTLNKPQQPINALNDMRRRLAIVSGKCRQNPVHWNVHFSGINSAYLTHIHKGLTALQIGCVKTRTKTPTSN